MHLLGRLCVCYDAFSLVLSLQNLYHRVMKCDITLHIFLKARRMYRDVDT